MSKKNIERLIPKAIEVARNKLSENGVIPKVYNSYISSFGASVSQAGLKSTIAYFRKDRDVILTALEGILGKGELEQIDSIHKILDAAVALKMAIRTFELTKDNK